MVALVVFMAASIQLAHAGDGYAKKPRVPEPMADRSHPLREVLNQVSVESRPGG